MGWGKMTYGIKAYKRGTKGGQRWLNLMNKMNVIINIRGIRKMYDSVNAMFKLDTTGGKGIESEAVE